MGSCAKTAGGGTALISALLATLACAASPPASAPPAKPAPAPRATAAVQTPVPPEPEPERVTLADVWRSALEGRPDETRARLAILFPKKTPKAGLDRVRVAAVDDESWLVAGQGGYLVLDPSGAPRRFVPIDEMDTDSVSVRVVPKTGRAVLRARGAYLLDVGAGRTLRAIPDDSAAIGGGRVVWRERGPDTELVVWDVARDAEVARGKPDLYAMILWASEDGGVVYIADGTTAAVLQVADGLAELSRHATKSTAAPALSPDGRFLAVVVSSSSRRGEVRLLERASGKRVGRTSACNPPAQVAFSPDGSKLVVGGPRSVCVLEMPSLRLRATVPAAFDSFNIPVLSFDFLRSGRALAVHANYGAVGVFAFPSLHPHFVDKGAVFELESGEIDVVDWSGNTRRLDAQLKPAVGPKLSEESVTNSFGETPSLARRLLDVRARAARSVCRVNQYLVPCVAPAP